jgi:hypothetical protein
VTLTGDTLPRTACVRRTGEQRRRVRPTPTTEDLTAVKLPRYDRRIRIDWSEPGQHAWNLAREIEDVFSRPELTTHHERSFLRPLKTKAIRGNEVWLAPMEQRRLTSICRRFTDAGHLAGWRKMLAEREAERASLAAEEAGDSVH